MRKVGGCRALVVNSFPRPGMVHQSLNPIPSGILLSYLVPRSLWRRTLGRFCWGDVPVGIFVETSPYLYRLLLRYCTMALECKVHSGTSGLATTFCVPLRPEVQDTRSMSILSF